MKKKRLGKLPPRYRFILNPHAEARFTKCPRCERSTNLRKCALFIHIDGHGPLVLGKTCRLCITCDLLIVHQDKLETVLTNMLATVHPSCVGSAYLVMGTVELPFWRRSLQKPAAFGEMLTHLADFKQHLQVGYRPAGWYRTEAG